MLDSVYREFVISFDEDVRATNKEGIYLTLFLIVYKKKSRQDRQLYAFK